MVDTKREILDPAELVKNADAIKRRVRGGMPPRLKPLGNIAQRWAKPHIRAHQVKGSTYYSYCRGTDKEIYLGSADFILGAVRAAREKE